MDYPMNNNDFSQQRQWPNLLTPNHNQQPHSPSSTFPSPVSPPSSLSDHSQFTYYSPQQQDRSTNLSLNLSALSVASPTNLSPINPHLSHQHPHSHSHNHSQSSVSLSPVSPPSSGSYLHPNATFQFAPSFDEPPSVTIQPPTLPPPSRRPVSAAIPSLTASSRSSSSSELEKSVPRKRSFTTNAGPASRDTLAPGLDKEGLAHALPHPIITTTASSPSPGSLPLPHHNIDNFSHPLSRPPSNQGRPSRSQQQPQRQSQIDISPSYDYDDPGTYTMLDTPDESDVDHDSHSFSDQHHAFGADNYDSAGLPFGDPAFVQGAGAGGSAGGSGTGLNVLGKPLGTNNFVTKLYQMINDPKSQHFIAWTELGTSFVVSNVGEFSRSILGSHFKHNNFSSFVRQLNMYGFHKINRTPRAHRTSTDAQTWEFSHLKFLRGRPDLLDEIKRKALEPDPGARHRVELPGEVAQQLRAVGDVRRELEGVREEVGRLWDAVGGRTNFVGDSGKEMTEDGASTSGGDGKKGWEDLEWDREDVKDVSVSGSGSVGDKGSGGERDEWRRRARDGERMSQPSPQSQLQLSPQSSSQGQLQLPSSQSPSQSQTLMDLARELAKERARAAAERTRDRSEAARERRRTEKLVGAVKALCEALGKTVPGFVPHAILQDLLELERPAPESDSPNIYITSPTSPTHSPSPSPHPYPHAHSPLSQSHPQSFSHPHSLSQSQPQSQSHPHHPPVLTIPTLHSHVAHQHTHSPSHSPSHSLSHSPSSLSSHSHSLSHSSSLSLSSSHSHTSSFAITPSSSPTGADFPGHLFGSGPSGGGISGQGQGGGHGRSISHASTLQPPSLALQPHHALTRQISNASFTFHQPTTPVSADGDLFDGMGIGGGGDGEGDERREKRQRVGGEGDIGMGGDDMDVEREDSSMVLVGGGGGPGNAGGVGNGGKRLSRARSDSAPMGWGDGSSGMGGGAGGGLSANWMSGRPRSGSGFVGGSSRLGPGEGR